MLEGLGWEPLDLTASDCVILDMLDRCPWVRHGTLIPQSAGQPVLHVMSCMLWRYPQSAGMQELACAANTLLLLPVLLQRCPAHVSRSAPGCAWHLQHAQSAVSTRP